MSFSTHMTAKRRFVLPLRTGVCLHGIPSLKLGRGACSVQASPQELVAAGLGDVHLPSLYEPLTSSWFKVAGQFPLRQDQMHTARFMLTHPRCFILSEPRAGKTASVLSALHTLLTSGQSKRVLIVCPKILVNEAWAKELAFHPELTFSAVLGSAAAKSRALAQDAQIYITNYNTLKTNFLALKGKGFDTIIFDEVSELAHVVFRGKKPHSPQQYAAAVEIGATAQRVYGMTGTVGQPLEAFTQAMLIFNRCDNKEYYAFRNKVMVKLGVRWVYRRGALKDSESYLYPCVRIKKADVIKLPDVEEAVVPIAIHPDAERDIQQLGAQGAILRGSGELTAKNAGVLMLRQLQIGAGFVVDVENDFRQRYDISPAIKKIQAILAASSTGRVLVYANFIGAADHLSEQLNAHGVSATVLNGSTSGGERTRRLEQWRKGEVQILIMHPKTGSFGLELAYTDQMIFYGAILTGAIIYAQAKERLLSPLQKAGKVCIHKFAFSKADEYLFQTLTSRVGLSEKVMEFFTTGEQV